MKTVEAYHNHRWIDSAKEGGLLLGIRSLPSPEKPYGDKKFSWDIYRALDTPDEAEVTKFAEQYLGKPEKTPSPTG